MSGRSILFISAAVLLLISPESSNGFALRIYPGFAPSYHERNSLVQESRPTISASDSLRATNTALSPMSENPISFKTMGYRRGGPLNDCTTYLDCKSRLLSYLDVMMKMSNKGR